MKLKKRTNNIQNIYSISIVILAIVTCSMLIGYAILSREVKINGTANVSAISFDVHFENIVETTKSVKPISKATISDNSTVSFNVKLLKPGDFYEFKVDVKNDGGIDAMINSIVKTPNLTPEQAKYLEYTAVYSDGGIIEPKDKLSVDQSKTILIRVKYKQDLNASDLPSNVDSFNLAYTLNFVQADNTAVVK